MRYHQMNFKTPCVHPGLNQTIRSGAGWLKARPGDRLDITETGQSVETSEKCALVIAAQEVTVEELDELLSFNHTPGARTMEGLDKAMASAYGEGWKEKPIVIVWFWV